MNIFNEIFKIKELLECFFLGARAPLGIAREKDTKEKVLSSNNLLIYYTTICKDLLVLLSPPPVCSLPIGKPFSVSTSVPPLAIMLVLLSPHPT